MAQVPSMDQTAVRHFDKLRLLATTHAANTPSKKAPLPAAPSHAAQPLRNRCNAYVGAAGFAVALCGLSSGVADVVWQVLRLLVIVPWSFGLF